MLASHLYKGRPLRLQKCKVPRCMSRPGETEGEFQVRLRDQCREERDVAVEKLRRKYAPKLKRLKDTIARAEERIEVEQSQYRSQKTQTAISLGATVLGALFGRKVGSVGTVGSMATTMRGAGRASREKEDIARAVQRADKARTGLQELEIEFEEETVQLRDKYRPEDLICEERLVRPRKSDLEVSRLSLAWCPSDWSPQG